MPFNAALTVDTKIRDALSSERPIVVVLGCKYSGKSQAADRLKASIPGVTVIDIPGSAGEQDYKQVRDVLRRKEPTDGAERRRIAIFMSHRQKEYLKARSKGEGHRSRLLGILSRESGGLFDPKSMTEIRLSVTPEEADDPFLRGYIKEFGAESGGEAIYRNLPPELRAKILDRSRYKEKDYETFVPTLIQGFAKHLCQKNVRIKDAIRTADEKVRTRLLNEGFQEEKLALEIREQHWRLLATAFGIEVEWFRVAAGVSFETAMKGAWDVVRPVIESALTLAVPGSTILLGAGLSIAHGLWKQKGGGKDVSLLSGLFKASGHWREMGDEEWRQVDDEERRFFCYVLERKRKFDPDEAFDALSELFDPRGSQIEKLESYVRDHGEEIRESWQENAGARTLLESMRSFNDRLDEVEEKLTSLTEAYAAMEKRMVEMEVRQTVLEEGVKDLRSRPTDITWDNLNGVIHAHAPILSLELQKKAQTALTALEKGDKVVILGEAGVGKSTLLYEICQTLLRRARRAGDDDLSLGAGALRGGETANLGRVVTAGMFGLGPDDVYVADNLTPRTPGFEKIVNLPCAVVATARAHMWARDQPPGWVEIHLSRGDFPTGILRKILESALEVEHVVSTPKGIEIAVQKSEGLPVYLVELARWLRFRKRSLDERTAEDAPPRVYDIVHDVLRSIKDREVIKLLYLLALTKRSRLHNIHLVELLDSREHDSSHLPDEFLEIVNNLPGPVYSLSHDTWKDVLLENWESQRGEREPAALVEFRSLRSLRDRVGPHLGAVREDDAFLKSVRQTCEPMATDAAILAQITLENRPELAERVLEEIHSKTEYADTVSMVSEVVALQNAPAVRSYISAKSVANAGDPRGQLSWLWGLSKQREGAPRFQILVLEVAETTGKPLVQGDQEFRADFAGVLNDLGGALLQVGEVDNATARCIQSEEMCRELAVLDQKYKPHHAKALLGLGIALREKGDVDDAIDRLRDSEVIYRELADHDQSFQPDLAAVLNSHGRALQRRNMDEAIKRLGESEAKYGELAKHDQNFQADHAKALLSLGIALRDRGVALRDRGDLGKGDVDNAIVCLKKSRDIYRALAGNDQRFQPELASVLNSLGRVLRRKDLPEAISCFRESERIRRGLADRDQRFELDLARLLNNLGFALTLNQDPSGAIDCFKECGEIYRRLTDRDQSRFEYAWDLFGVGKGVVNLDLAEAIKDFRASEAICRRLASQDKTLMRTHAEFLTSLGNALKAQGDKDEGDAYLQESETILRGLSN